MTIYGTQTERSPFGNRGVIGDVDLSPYGNVILRVGHANDGHGTTGDDGSSWEQTEHVVLDPTEALEFATELLQVATQGHVTKMRRLAEASK